MDRNIIYLTASIFFSLSYLSANLYDIDDSIKIKGKLWTELSHKYFSFMDFGITYYQDNILDDINKLRFPILILLFIFYTAYKGDKNKLYIINIIFIILSLLLFSYSTFVYNKLDKDICSYTHLSLPRVDLYLIPKIIFVIMLITLYFKNFNLFLLLLILSQIVYSLYYYNYGSQGFIKCSITNIGGIYLNLILISIYLFSKVNTTNNKQ